MRFQPVYWPPDKQLPGFVRQSFLKHLNLCPRSAFLLQLYEGQTNEDGVQSARMMRGRAGHRILELARKAAIDAEESRIPGEVAKAIAAEVLADVEYAVHFEEHDYLREMAYRYGESFEIKGKPIANERLIEFELAGWTIHCHVDYAEQGEVFRIEDAKTGRGAPAFSKITRKRPDGTHRMVAFQLVTYALGMSGEWRDEVVCEFVYPGIPVGDERRMLRQTATIRRYEIEEDAQSLAALLKQLDERLETGDWPAVVSDEACGICPAEALCPIPAELNPHRVDLEDADACAEALEYHDLTGMLQGRLGDRIKAFLRVSGPVRYGGNMEALVELDKSQRGRLVKRVVEDEA